MDLLKERILKDGAVRPGNILKVDSFINHQIDIKLLNEIGKEFYRHFNGHNITRIVTIEASGIGIACIAAQYFDVPVVFAKKAKSKNLDGDLYQTVIKSYTHGTENVVVMEKKFLTSSDRILIIDDFLATGKALFGLLELAKQANASVAG
ncbi:MAG: xanthine phosphoribosyltransferase, partial [Pygmaiobacter sp.]